MNSDIERRLKLRYRLDENFSKVYDAAAKRVERVEARFKSVFPTPEEVMKYATCRFGCCRVSPDGLRAPNPDHWTFSLR